MHTFQRECVHSTAVNSMKQAGRQPLLGYTAFINLLSVSHHCFVVALPLTAALRSPVLSLATLVFQNFTKTDDITYDVTPGWIALVTFTGLPLF